MAELDIFCTRPKYVSRLARNEWVVNPKDGTSDRKIVRVVPNLNATATDTHVVLRVHIGALLEQQRRGGRVIIRSRTVKWRQTTLHTGERGEESG